MSGRFGRGAEAPHLPGINQMLCSDCRVEMTIVAVITDPRVVDSILRHVDQGGGHDPHAPRAPPAA